MISISNTVLLLSGACLFQQSGRVSAAAVNTRAALSAYAPRPASCPDTPLLRAANGIGESETTYVEARKVKADASLTSWLAATDPTLSTNDLPTLALVVSGGGLRSLLCGAGVVQAFDSRDSSTGTSGIFQSLTYQSGLSGGAWLTSSIAGNNWPTVSSLKSSLWEDTFRDTLLLPENLLFALAYSEIVNDVLSKAEAGYDPTIIDAYGRLLGYQLLEGTNGGVATSISGLALLSNFTGHNVPFPIITARGLLDDQCIPDTNATQWEFTPYEFGSWDTGVEAFTQTAFLGSALTNGEPTVSGVCTTNYDNLGYIMGTSSNVFNQICNVVPAINSTSSLTTTLEAILDRAHDAVERDLFATYPNPFYKYPNSSLVSAQLELNLVDGGEGGQNIPVWPFIQDARSVDVLIVNDNSADTTDDFPNGTEIHVAYQQAQIAGLTKMPFIPTSDIFVSEALNKRAVFFGCDDQNAVTIVYLPNNNYTYSSNVATADLQYNPDETDAVISNANLIATQDGNEGWPVCLGCAIMKKTGSVLPEACVACFDFYCYTA